MILFATSMGAFLNPMIASMVILALPAIGLEFGVSARDLGWMTTAFILATAILLVPASRLVDSIGYKKSYIIGGLIVAVSCFFSIFAPDYSTLIILRIITGMGSAFVMITGLAILTRVYPANKRGMVIGINTAMVYVGASVGPIIGGSLTEYTGWRSIFLLMVPLLLISIALMIKFLRQEFKNPGKSFDIKGTILYAAAIFCTMFGLSTITDNGSLFLALAGIVLVVIFIWYERRVAEPVLHVNLFFKNTRFARSSYTALLNYSCTYGSVYMVSLYLQSIGALNAVEAGFIIFFQPLIQAIMTPIAGKLSDRFDPRYLVTLGMALSAIGVILLAGLGLTSAVSYIAITQVFIGLGSALFSAPNTNAIMSAVSQNEYSSASSIVAVMRQLGMILSMAICMAAISIFVGGLDMLGPDMYPEFVQALQVSMLICAGLAVIGIFFSWFRGKAPAGEDI
jgi:EmrB/QacA subfamily drug resistance transporter